MTGPARDRARSRTDREKKTRILILFRTNRHRLPCHDLRTLGLTIGSGIVKVANRTRIGWRPKRFGMRWSVTGAQAVPTICSRVKSNRFDAVWRQIMTSFACNRPVNNNEEIRHQASSRETSPISRRRIHAPFVKTDRLAAVRSTDRPSQGITGGTHRGHRRRSAPAMSALVDVPLPYPDLLAAIAPVSHSYPRDTARRP